MLRDLGHVEERDDGLVGGLDEQDLEGVPSKDMRSKAVRTESMVVQSATKRKWIRKRSRR